jgi:hypothetical protein
MIRASARTDNRVPFGAYVTKMSNKSVVMTREEALQITTGEKTGKRRVLTGDNDRRMEVTVIKEPIQVENVDDGNDKLLC